MFQIFVAIFSVSLFTPDFIVDWYSILGVIFLAVLKKNCFCLFLGETIKIVIEDYVQHLSNYNYKLLFKPELLFGEPFQYQNRIALEFNHLYHWHPLMPDEFTVGGKNYTMSDFLQDPGIVQKHGIATFVDSLSRQRAGAVSIFYISFSPPI